MANIETRKIHQLKPHEKNAVIYNDKADAPLIKSIKENGIITPLLITKGNVIISGHRRLDAAKKFGLSEVPVTVFSSVDPLKIRVTLVESNNSRTKTNEQIGREAKELMAIESELAKIRQKRKSGDSVPVNLPGQTGDSRDVVGKRMGKSGRTIEKAIKVVTLIDTVEDSEQVSELKKSLDKSVEQGYNYAKRKGLLETDSEEQIDDFYTLDDWKVLTEDEKADALISSKNTGFNRTTDSVEWAHWTWNPVTGCLHGCEFCYARDRANRYYHKIPGDRFQPVIHPNRLSGPSNAKVPQKKYDDPVDQIGNKTVFTCSMADLFGKWVPNEWIEAVLKVIRENPQWNFILLANNPKRYVGLEFPDNAWVGVTVWKQSRVKQAESVFKKVKAKVKFLSCEPLMEDLTFTNLSVFDWVIIGGASASKATGGSKKTEEFRPQREWINHLEDQANRAGCKVYEKTNLWERIREYPEFIEAL